MSLEPGLESVVARLLDEETAALVDWSGYRMCPACKSPIGEPCLQLGGVVQTPVGMQQVRKTISHPHAARRPTARRRY